MAPISGTLSDHIGHLPVSVIDKISTDRERRVVGPYAIGTTRKHRHYTRISQHFTMFVILFVKFTDRIDNKY